MYFIVSPKVSFTVKCFLSNTCVQWAVATNDFFFT
jgi:hypothetical protein